MHVLRIAIAAVALVVLSHDVQASPFAYVADFDTPSSTGTITVIDIATDSVVGSIPLPTGHASRLALNPLGTRVYVAHADIALNQVSAIDTSTQTFVEHVQGVGNVPSDVVVSPTGARAFATNRYDDTIAVIDTATDQVVTTIPLGSGAAPGSPIYLPLHLALSPDGSRLYVTNHWAFTVSVIDTATNAVVGTIPVGHYPAGIAFAPSGTRAYVANFTDGSVSVIDTASTSVVATVTFAQGDALTVATSPTGDRAYVTSRDLGRINVIDTATNTVVNTIQVGTTPNGIALDSSGSRLYVTNFDDNSVSVVDTSTYAVHTITGVGNEPVAIAVQSTTCQDALPSVVTLLDTCETDLQTSDGVLADTTAALAAAEIALAAATSDADGDGVRDATDACPDTAIGVPVDQVGCSLAQFCAAIATTDGAGRRACKKADWRNDEPVMKGSEADCAVQRGAADPDHACAPAAP